MATYAEDFVGYFYAMMVAKLPGRHLFCYDDCIGCMFCRCTCTWTGNNGSIVYISFLIPEVQSSTMRRQKEYVKAFFGVCVYVMLFW